MHQGRPKNSTKMSPDGPKWTLLGPVLHTLDTLGALLATWGTPLRIFMHFYEVYVHSCACHLQIHGNPRKIKQIALQFMSIAQKHRKRY